MTKKAILFILIIGFITGMFYVRVEESKIPCSSEIDNRCEGYKK